MATTHYGEPLETVAEKIELMRKWIKGTGDSVTAYHKRSGNSITLHFENGDVNTGLTNIRYALEKEFAGDRENKFQISADATATGFIVTMSAQTYIHKFGGEIPGRELQK